MINSFTYNGTNTEELGLYVGGQHTFGAPQRDVTKVSIPGRNGDLVRDNGRFLNSEIVYNIVAMNEFAESAKNVRNWLMRSSGYHRLEDTYDPDHFRMARVAGTVDFETGAYNATGKTQVTFDCMPQRFLKSGETVISGDPVEKSASGEIASFETDYVVPMTSAEVSLSPQRDLNGYDSPWPGGGGKNLLPDTMTSPTTANGVTFTRNSKGEIAFSGTTSSSDFSVSVGTVALAPGSYILTGGISTSARLRLSNATGDVYIGQDNGNGYSFTLSEATTVLVKMRLTSTSGTSVSGTYKPMIRLASVTDASFAPYSNICPISGHTGAELIRTGKNLLDANDMVAGILNTSGAVDTQNVTIQSKGNGSVSWESTGTWRGVTTGFIDVRGNNVYRISLAETVSYVLYAWYDRNKSFISRASYSGSNMQSVTAPENAFYVRFTFQQSAAGTYTYTNIQLELGSSASSYEPYQGTTYSVTFTDQGTVYWGTFDFATGKLRVEYGSYTFTGSESWYKWSYPWAYDTSITANGYSMRFSDIKSSAKANIISDAFVLSSTTARNLRAAVEWSLVDCCINNVVDYDYIVIRYDSITDPATFAQYMAGKTIVYELETPLEYTLSAQQIETLQGENNVWSDAGEISLTFYDPAELDNPTMFDSKPLIRAYGSGDGQVTIGNQIIALTDIDGYIDIDCETMDCYNGVENCNSKVTLGAQGFPTLPPGITAVSFGGGVTRVEITPRWWEL